MEKKLMLFDIHYTLLADDLVEGSTGRKQLFSGLSQFLEKLKSEGVILVAFSQGSDLQYTKNEMQMANINPRLFAEIKVTPQTLHNFMRGTLAPASTEFQNLMKRELHIKEPDWKAFLGYLRIKPPVTHSGAQEAFLKAYIAYKSMKKYRIARQNVIIVGNSQLGDLGAARMLGVQHAAAAKFKKYSLLSPALVLDPKRRITAQAAEAKWAAVNGVQWIDRQPSRQKKNERIAALNIERIARGKPQLFNLAPRPEADRYARWHKQKAVRNFLGYALWKKLVSPQKRRPI